MGTPFGAGRRRRGGRRCRADLEGFVVSDSEIVGQDIPLPPDHKSIDKEWNEWEPTTSGVERASSLQETRLPASTMLYAARPAETPGDEDTDTNTNTDTDTDTDTNTNANTNTNTYTNDNSTTTTTTTTIYDSSNSTSIVAL